MDGQTQLNLESELPQCLEGGNLTQVPSCWLASRREFSRR
jgi:hypothetical protein